jgi:hypothetical protein
MKRAAEAVVERGECKGCIVLDDGQIVGKSTDGCQANLIRENAPRTVRNTEPFNLEQ